MATVLGDDVLVVDELTVDYGGFRANDQVSFNLREGAIHALIGPNGAGKTTCFNAICGFTRPTGGSVRIKGRPVPPGNPHAVWASGVARTFQRLELFWTLSVRDNLALAARRARKLRDRPAADVEAILARTGLGSVADDVVANLPLGTCRVVELGRALATGADILLLDESSSGLDRAETEAFEAIVRGVAREFDLSVLLIEHDMEFVMALADHIFVLDFGKLIAEGTPTEIQGSPVVHQVYLGGDLPEAVQGEAP